MQFYLQFGFNMQVVCRELIADWGGGTVIMSPRDCAPPDEEKGKPCEIEKHASSIRGVGGTVLIDPQFYVPDSDHQRLTKHGYWPEEYDSVEFWKEDSQDYEALIKNVAELNARTQAGALIVPGTLASEVNDEWLDRQAKMIGTAANVFPADKEHYATVALSAAAMRDSDQIHSLLSASNNWGTHGIYLVCEHPENKYLVEEDAWVINLLDLTAGFRLRGFKVVIGYANQQMLAAACAGATAIASGSHQLKRRFSSADMMNNDDDAERQQATWYYSPTAYSEFKVTRLDTAKSAGLLDKLRHPAELGVTYADVLFAGPQPSTITAYKHKLSFKHYLGCLSAQADAATKPTFNDTLAAYRQSIDDAEALLNELAAKRVRAEDRSFLPVVDPTHVGLTTFEEERGAMMRRRWPSL